MKKALFSVTLLICLAFIVWQLRITSKLDLSYSESVIHDSPQVNLPDGAKIRLGKGKMEQIALSPDGDFLAVATKFGIWIYDITNTEKNYRLIPCTSSIECIAFSPDGQTIASGSQDGTIRLWRVDTGKQKQTFIGHTYEIYTMVFSPDGKTLASASIHKINLWDLKTGTHKETFHQNARSISRMIFNRDGLIFANVNGDIIQLSDVLTGKQKHTLKGHTKSIRRMSFSPDGKTFASVVLDNRIHLWDVNTGEQKKILKIIPSPIILDLFEVVCNEWHRLPPSVQ